MFSDHSRIKLGTKAKKYLKNPQIFGKFKTTLLNNQWVKEKVTGNWKII